MMERVFCQCILLYSTGWVSCKYLQGNFTWNVKFEIISIFSFILGQTMVTEIDIKAIKISHADSGPQIVPSQVKFVASLCLSDFTLIEIVSQVLSELLH